MNVQVWSRHCQFFTLAHLAPGYMSLPQVLVHGSLRTTKVRFTSERIVIIL